MDTIITLRVGPRVVVAKDGAAVGVRVGEFDGSRVGLAVVGSIVG